MGEKLFKRLEKFRIRHKLSILAFCRQLKTSHVNYHRWKKAQQIAGPYKKIIEDFLDKNEKSQAFKESLGQSSSEIAVIGMACYYPGAANIQELWENILARRVQFRRMLDSRLPLSEYYDADPKFPEKIYVTKVALIENFTFDWAKWRIPRKTFESTDIAHWLALDTAVKAFEDAGYKPGDIPLQNTGVVVGNTLTGEQTRSQTLRLRWPYVRKTLDVTLDKLGLTKQERHRVGETMEGIYKSAFYPMTEDSLAGGLANTIAGRICNYLNLKGGGYIVDGACSSSLLAIATAASALKMKDVDLVLAGGVDISLDPFELVGFSRAGALAKDKMQVYDKNASGFIPGEGSGFVVLKRLEDALRDKNYIYSVIKGWGISSDGKGGIMEPSSNGQALAIERAYKNVPYKITEIDFIEGHGTGTAKGDRVELEGIASAITKQKPKGSERAYGITSFKSIVGHTKAAAGVGGFIKAVLAVNQRILPPTANCKAPNEIFEGTGKCLYPIREGSILDDQKEVRGGVSSAGFGGINCHIALESKDAPKKELKPAVDERALFVSHQETEVFVFAVQTVSLLKNLILKFKDDLHFISQAEMVDLSHRLAKNIKKNAPVKVAIVTDSPENLYQALCLVEQELSKDIPEGQTLRIKSPIVNTQIILSNKPKPARVGFLYPGQASQRLNMTRMLFERFGWARELANVTQTPIAQFIYKSSDQFLTKEEGAEFEKKLSGTDVTQLAVTFSSLVWTEFLTKLGISPDIVGGHSLGELCAFYKAGAFTKQELLKFAEFRGKSMAASNKKSGGMVSLLCSHTKAKELVSRMNGNLVVANINSLSQIVVSGDKADIERLLKEAKKQEIAYVLLPVSNAFHSTFMQNASKLIKEHKSLRKSFKPSGVDLYSCMDGKKFAGGAALNDYFSRQVISQVNFVELVESMSKECDLFIEVGPGRVLTDLVKSINTDKAPLCLPVEGSVGNDRDLNLVLAELFVRGALIRWDELYKNRLIRPFVPVSKKKFIVNQCERPLKVPENIGTINADFSPAVPSAIELSGPAKALEEVFEDSSQKNLLPVSDGGSIGQMLIYYVEKLTGFNKESLGLNLRLLDDLNLDSIKAAELIAEVAKALGVPGEIEPAQYSNRTLEEVRQKFEELVAVKKEGRSQAGNQADILKRYQDKAWVRNFVERFEPQPLEKTETKKIFKNILIVADSDGIQLAQRIKEKFSDSKTRVVSPDEIDVNQKPECVIVIVPALQNAELTKENLHKRMEETHKILSIAANAQDVLFAQLGTGDFKQSSIRAITSTLHLERPDLRLRIIDFNRNVDNKTISGLIDVELSQATSFAIAGYTAKGHRQVPIFEVSNPHSYKPRDISWSKADVVLVTGGAKGITAECALEFGRQNKTTMILAGRSAKDAEIQKTLERFKKENLVCEYVQCDVTAQDQVKAAIKDIEKRLGKVTAVIHGAGLNSLRRLSQASLEDVYMEALPKVIGVVNILDAINPGSLKLFVAMASIIGVTGMEASGWYGFANEIFVNYLRNYSEKNKATQIIALCFSVWDEVGMGKNLGSIEKLSQRGIGSIPVLEGVKRFEELIKGDPQSDQLIVTSRVPGLDTFELREFQQGQSWRFLEQVRYCVPQVELIAQANLNTQDDSYVLDHNWKGSLLFPMVFGLEAMTQAACYVTATEKLQSLRIKNINLERPISVSPASGTNIEIHAQVLESTEKWPQQVRVEIYCEQTNYKEPHFSAVLELNPKIDSLAENDKPNSQTQKVLDIDPPEDLYGPILFQGKMFQGIEKIHELSYDEQTKKGQCLVSLNLSKTDNLMPRFNNGFLIGNPFLVDSILQSMQVIVTQESCLPNYIGKIEIFNLAKVKLIGRLVIKSNLKKISEHFLRGTSYAFRNNEVFVRIGNCHLKIIEHMSENPSANEIVNPMRKDRGIFEAFISKISVIEHVVIPKIHFDFRSSFTNKNKIQRREDIKKWLKTIGYKDTNKLTLTYSEENKPIIKVAKGKQSEISISHKGNYLLLSLGQTSQGIDIEDIQDREIDEWQSILNSIAKSAFNQLLSIGVELNTAGTCAWTIAEVLYKATNKYGDKVTYEGTHQGNYIFSSDLLGENFRIVSGVIHLIRGKAKILSFIVNYEMSKEKTQTLQERITSDSLDSLGFAIKDLCGVGADYTGPQDQLVFKCHFPVTFKNILLFSKNLYFTSYFDFCGTLREYSIFPILKQFLETAKSGKTSMVTKMTSVDVYRPVQIGDILEGRLWMDSLKGSRNSTMNMLYEWNVINRGEAYKVAECKQDTIWIKINENGKAEIDDYPPSVKEYVDLMKPKTVRIKTFGLINKPFQAYSGRELDILGEHLPNRYKVFEKTIESTLEHSNLLSNIYFSSFAKWIGQLTDEYCYVHLSEFYKDYSGEKEIFCSNCTIDFYNEAFPFDKILIEMYINKVFENGTEFYFEFHKVEERKRVTKLASASQQILFVSIKNNALVALKVPDQFIEMVRKLKI